jgi:hypothetical protein
MAKRDDDARTIRDRMWDVITAYGELRELDGQGRFRVLELAELSAILRTPFQSLPGMGGYRELRNLPPEVRPLAYGLDIWDERGKVFNLEWDDHGHWRLIAFRRGTWEAHVEELGRRARAQQP